MFGVRGDGFERDIYQLSIIQKSQFVPSKFGVFPAGVVDPALAQFGLVSDKEGDGDARLYAKDVVRGAGDFGVAANV